MTRRIRYAALLGALFLAAACQREEWPADGGMSASDGYVTLRAGVEIPSMPEVVTRSVDPDGLDVQTLTLFCFDSYGLFISTADAELDRQGDMQGSLTARVPENTRTIHFIGNQNMQDFAEDSFRNKSEAEVMAVLEGSAGKMIYWARFACAAGDNRKIDEQMQGSTIVLVRNQARVSVLNPTGNGFLEVTGFVVCNTNAYGTVAPWHPQEGFVWPGTEPFITLPQNRAVVSDIMDVRTASDQYVFESENASDNPVSVILRGHLPGEDTDFYYRVMLIDDEGEQVLIRRNCHYRLNIAGTLSYGQPDFASALEAPATNNVWVSISDEVNEVEDQNYILAVAKTSYVLGEEETGDSYTLYYTVTGKNGTRITEADLPSVTWLDGNKVGGMNVGNRFARIENNTVGYGEITVNLLRMGENDKLEGTLLVKKGRLQRKIKVITVKTQKFEPAWVGTQVYGHNIGEHVTLMFTIPESCPQELLPLRVLISTNDLDVRHESGMDLPLVFKGEEGYGELDNEWGYKYVYTARQTGVQRVYFENVLLQGEGHVGDVMLEANFFDELTKQVVFADHQFSITVSGLNEYNNLPGGDYAEDDVILYRLVPQKKGANVQFDMQMMNNGEQPAQPVNAGDRDEFLLYSQNLNYYLDDETDKAGVAEFDCTFYPIDEESWGSGGRVHMFMPKRPQKPASETGRYAIYMYTNRTQSAEVVRIASNQPGSSSGYPGNGGAPYEGNAYRSVTFELANYNPFRFAARVNGEGTDTSGAEEETVTPLSWTYRPQQQVDIELDVTSFAGSDGKSVDPFGEPFEIYIDAPMLEIDESRLAECNLTDGKLKADPSVPGRFIYTVDAQRSTERTFGTGSALKKDGTLLDNGGSVDQAGERKRLPFLTGEVVSAGDITVSSDEEMVVFFRKTFRVTNESIRGIIRYNDNGVMRDVPRNAFVSFERVSNGTRIGSMTITADGEYELRLRKEYAFNWYTDPIGVYYRDGEGNTWHADVTSLADLFDDTAIEMRLEEGN